MLTKEQVKGSKFEIWLEELFKKIGFQNVMRNVEFHRSRYLYRQVDVCYEIVKEGKIYRVIAEAKFSSNGPVRYHLRNGEIHKCEQGIAKIDNIVDELLERASFVGASYARLLTNRTFEDEVRAEAKRHSILVLEGNELQKLYMKTGRTGSIDDAIYNVSLKGKMHSNIIYI
jgi:hypothetical protein